MQKARLIVTGASESRRKNFQITCYADHLDLCFWSGSRGNQVVLQVDDEGAVYADVVRVTWREWLKEVFTKF